LAVRDAKCKRGILVGRSLQELRVLRELFQKVSEHVSITTYEEIEKQAFTWMPSIARHILFGDGDEEVETVSFGHGFDERRQNAHKEDMYMKRGFMDPCQSQLDCACFDSSRYYPQAVKSLFPPDGSSLYASEWDYLVALDLPENLHQLHATNFLCARHRWVIARGEMFTISDIQYGLSMTTSKRWNPTGTTSIFTSPFGNNDDDPFAGSRLRIRNDSGCVVYVNAPEDNGTKRKRSVQYDSRSDKEERKKGNCVSQFTQIVNYAKPIARCYFVFYTMPRCVYDLEASTYKKTKDRDVLYRNFKEIANTKTRVSQVIATMARDTSRFRPTHTLILTSFAESLPVFDTALRFLRGARVITVTKPCQTHGYRYLNKWKQPSPFAFRFSIDGHHHISMEDAMTNVARVVVGDAFAGGNRHGELIRTIRHHSPNCVITWVCYRGSYEESLAKYTINSTGAPSNMDREMRRTIVLMHRLPPKPSEFSPACFDEETFTSIHSTANTVNLEGHQVPLLSHLAPHHNVTLSRAARYLYCLRGKNNSQSDWVALPHSLLSPLYEFLSAAYKSMIPACRRRSIKLNNKIDRFCTMDRSTFSAHTRSVSARGVWPPVYGTTSNSSETFKEFEGMIERIHRIEGQHMTCEGFAQTLGPLSIHRMKVANGKLEEDPDWQCELDPETLWAMRRERHHVVLTYMPSVERQLQLFSWLRPGLAERRRNTLLLLGTGCDHDSPLDCSERPGEIALFTQDSGLIGYTCADLIYPTFFQMAYHSNNQQFLEYAPPYAQDDLFRKINEKLGDREIRPSLPHMNTTWYSYTLETKTASSHGEQPELLQKDQSATPSTATSDHKK